MLTADLVPVRRKNGELHLTPIAGKSREQHLELAEQVMAVVLDSEGMTREQLLSEIAAVGHTPVESKIVKGYAKLIEDAVAFEEDRGQGAATLRKGVFERASVAWQELADDAKFDRDRVLAEVSAVFELEPGRIDEELFIDLPAAQRVKKSVSWSAEDLVERYDHGRVAAILLRAVIVKATFRVHSNHDVRQLFSALKFRRLLFELVEQSEGRYQLSISGPYSLFDAVTKYGLQLALCWPILAAQSEVSVEAELRWGKQNEKLRFRVTPQPETRVRGQAQSSATAAGERPDEETLGEELTELRQGLERAMPGVSVTGADVMLELPGVGLCVPDLACKFEDGTTVYVEVMGFWSRDAVFRRIELVEAGLPTPILFLVSNRLRVSEELLDDKSSGALYVYRGRINPVTAAGKLTALAARRQKPARARAGRRQK